MCVVVWCTNAVWLAACGKKLWLTAYLNAVYFCLGRKLYLVIVWQLAEGNVMFCSVRIRDNADQATLPYFSRTHQCVCKLPPVWNGWRGASWQWSLSFPVLWSSFISTEFMDIDCYHHYHKHFSNADIITQYLSDFPYFTIQTNKGQRQFQVLLPNIFFIFFLFLPILKWRTHPQGVYVKRVQVGSSRVFGCGVHGFGITPTLPCPFVSYYPFTSNFRNFFSEDVERCRTWKLASNSFKIIQKLKLCFDHHCLKVPFSLFCTNSLLSQKHASQFWRVYAWKRF